ncbi:MAG: ABC transporter permease [Lachnospiraceae bacterium]|nr:ABC transporter permease [Lachnospiraceae bacterium]
MAFTSEAHYGKTNLEKAYNDKIIYQIIDGYTDPDEFEAFRAEPNALNIIKNYYNELINANTFDYLAMFDQSVKSDDLHDIKTFQMNKQAVNYFNLNVVNGRQFEEKDFCDNNNVIPVLLGNIYKGSFKVGDTISVTYYQKKIQLQVIGFLRENTMVYFNGNPEFYLDEYIIMPYINYNDAKTEFDEWFQKIVYFSMINGYISVDSEDIASQNMKMELESISEKTGFYNYLFIGENPNVQKYRGLINIINKNYELIIGLWFLFLLANFVIFSAILYMIQKKRMYIVAIHYLNGATRKQILKYMFVQVSVIVALGTIIGWRMLTALKIQEGMIIAVTTLMALILTIWGMYNMEMKLKKVDLLQLINGEE